MKLSVWISEMTALNVAACAQAPTIVPTARTGTLLYMDAAIHFLIYEGAVDADSVVVQHAPVQNLYRRAS
jgi:hypothetical protein